jgi:NADH dehydrogenase (ubiquinone) 1 beta subcomplex subunit 7
MIATVEEMESAKLPLADRDFCAHLLLKYRACRADKAPWLWRCGHEKHEYLQCEYEE